MSTILDALRKAQAEGGDKPEIPEPEFPPLPPDDPLPPSDSGGSGDEPSGGPPPGNKPPRSYKAVGVIVLGVSLGLLLGRLLLPLATAPPDSSDLLAEGVAEKHDDLLAAAEVEENKDLSPGEMRRKKREEAQQEREDTKAERREKRGTETAEAEAGNGADDAAERAQEKPSSDSGSAAVPVSGEPLPSSPVSDGVVTDGDAEAAARGVAGAGVVVPATLPRPESPSLSPSELQAARAGAVPAAGVSTDGPTVLANVVPPRPPAGAPAAPSQVPPGLEALGRDPLTGAVAGAAPPAPGALRQPVTSPPPPPPNAPPPKALPGAPDDAPKIRLLFIQWSPTPEKRVVSLRQEGGTISVVREGEIVQGMRLAAIHPSGVEFQWRGKSFAVPVSRY